MIYIVLFVLFMVEDVNDNVFMFSVNIYKFYVFENLFVFYIVVKVYVKDCDEGFNSEIKYLIVGVEDICFIGKFEIDLIFGYLKIIGVLDREFME